MLRDVQGHPEIYRNLLARISGHNDCFALLGRETQEEIIRRTEQKPMKPRRPPLRLR